MLQEPSPASQSTENAAHALGGGGTAEYFESEDDFFEYARTQFSKNPGGGRPEKKCGCAGPLHPASKHESVGIADTRVLRIIGRHSDI